MKKIKTYIDREGVVKSGRSFDGTLNMIRSEFSVIKYIVGSELRIKIFDKTLGYVFLLLEPLLMASVYYVLTMVVLGSNITNLGFMDIYVAVVFWRWFSRTVDNAPALFNTYGTVLKQTNFPVYSILLSYLGMEFINLCFSFFILTIFLSIMGFYPNISYLTLPLVMLSQFSLMLFLTLISSVAGAFFKDLQGILYAFVAIWFYMSPGIYPVGNIPDKYLWVYNLNPFAHILPAYRSILLRGEIPNFEVLGAMFIIFAFLAYLSLKLLAKARYHFFSYL
jgi:lipopolysaccharide transport system permease protein